MIYCLTGTRDGMSSAQQLGLKEILHGCYPENATLHHGGCRGADTEAHTTVACLATRIIRPGDWQRHAYWAKRGDYHELLEPRPYLDRNKDIVRACDMLIAAPRTLTEELRSGTWATIRYARKQGVAVIILDPGAKS